MKYLMAMLLVVTGLVLTGPAMTASHAQGCCHPMAACCNGSSCCK